MEREHYQSSDHRVTDVWCLQLDTCASGEHTLVCMFWIGAYKADATAMDAAQSAGSEQWVLTEHANSKRASS